MDSNQEPKGIQKLDDAVVNRIAAGEVIQRPASAVKEMLENSLDAGSTSIAVVAKGGGMISLQITDNGHGIQKADFGIVCERFTTSKLREYDDLKNISTFGFRGEALASISHVAKLSITSATAGQPCAYRASYSDGKLAAGGPTPCAGVKGTTIMVEDLFFNVSTRKKAIRNLNDEYNRILEVVTRYSIHNAGVGFTCKKAGSNSSELHTLMSASILENLTNVYSRALTKELLEVSSESEKLEFKMKGYVSNANYNLKKGVCILFINDRLVESSSIKKAIDAAYSKYLPKGSHPFFYLSLTMNSKNLDVNVHPTKREVHFLNEEDILVEIVAAIESKLANLNESRTFQTQTILPGAQKFIQEASEVTAPPSDKPVYANAIVRINDPNPVGQLESYFIPKPKRSRPEGEGDAIAVSQPIIKRQAVRQSAPKVELSSVNNLWSNITKQCHDGLQQILHSSVFVGCADDKYIFIQSGTKLYLMNSCKVSKDLFYQQAVLNFAHFEKIHLSAPTSLEEIALVALDFSANGWNPSAGSKEKVAKDVAQLLTARREMLDEYLSISIDEDGRLCTLPSVLLNHVPDLDALPTFILRLGTEVNWLEEEPCFHDLAREVAQFYSSRPCSVAGKHGAVDNSYGRLVQHVLFPAFKKSLMPATSMGTDGCLVEVACLQKLFKIFERC